MLDTRSQSAVAEVEFSCDPINPGDVAIPFRRSRRLRSTVLSISTGLAPSSGKLNGRILLGNFDANAGYGREGLHEFRIKSGVKVGDYFKAVRPYTLI